MQPRVDDPSIRDEEVLWRRVLPEWTTMKGGTFRPTSQTFKDRRSYELSVHIASLTTIDKVLAAYPGQGIVAITAGDVRSLGSYAIVRDPIINDPDLPDDPSHALICPSPTGSAASSLARLAVWVREPQRGP